MQIQFMVSLHDECLCWRGVVLLTTNLLIYLKKLAPTPKSYTKTSRSIMIPVYSIKTLPKNPKSLMKGSTHGAFHTIHRFSTLLNSICAFDDSIQIQLLLLWPNLEFDSFDLFGVGFNSF